MALDTWFFKLNATLISFSLSAFSLPLHCLVIFSISVNLYLLCVLQVRQGEEALGYTYSYTFYLKP